MSYALKSSTQCAQRRHYLQNLAAIAMRSTMNQAFKVCSLSYLSFPTPFTSNLYSSFSNKTQAFHFFTQVAYLIKNTPLRSYIKKKIQSCSMNQICNSRNCYFYNPMWKYKKCIECIHSSLKTLTSPLES
jgi:hypothetical protein